jgi:TetR/AcrR family transcriptional repressor of nem operon
MSKSGAKEKLVDAARRLMLSKGYAATTVDEICEEAGLSKGSFYHFFPTKEEIGLAALEAFHQRGQKRLAEGPYASIADPVERVFSFIDHAESVSKDLWSEGCLLGTFSVDLAETHPAVRKRVSELFDKSIANMAKVFEPIASKNKSGPSAQELAEHFISLLEGAIVLGKAYDDIKRIPESIREFKRYLQVLVA